MIYQTLGMLALLALVYSAISGWIERTPINGALVYTAFGLAFGGMGLGWIGFDIEAEGFRVIAEITLGVVLFSDAAGTDFKVLKRNLDIPQRLLLIGLPLTILLGVGAGIALFDNLSIIEIAIIATMLAPTDAALGKAVVSDPRVPAPMRQSLNVESGLNDGICVPVLFAFLALASESDGEGGLLILLVEEIGIGAICGLGITWLAAKLFRVANANGLIGPTWRQFIIVSLAVLCFTAAQLAGGSGFIAAFVGGMFFGSMIHEQKEELLESAEATGDLLSMITWTIFGAAVVGPALGAFTWQVLLYSILSLTVVRMLPVFLSLLGTKLNTGDKLFMGWFGPRGLASIVFAVIVFNASLPGGDTITITIICTVLFSVILHGVTANPWVKAMDSRPKQGETT